MGNASRTLLFKEIHPFRPPPPLLALTSHTDISRGEASPFKTNKQTNT